MLWACMSWAPELIMMLRRIAVFSALSHTATCKDWLVPQPLKSLLPLEGGATCSGTKVGLRELSPCCSPGEGALNTSSLPDSHVPPTVPALEEQMQVLPGDMTPTGRCTLNQTEPTKASAETDRNKKQGKTGAGPPRCTLRPSLSLVVPLSRASILHKHLAPALLHSKTLHSLTPGWVPSHLLLFALLEAALRDKRTAMSSATLPQEEWDPGLVIRLPAL